MAEYDPIGGGSSADVEARIRRLLALRDEVEAGHRRILATEQRIGTTRGAAKEREVQRTKAANVELAKQAGLLDDLAVGTDRVSRAYQRWQQYEERIGQKEASGQGRGLPQMYARAQRLRTEFDTLLGEAEAAGRRVQQTPVAPTASTVGGAVTPPSAAGDAAAAAAEARRVKTATELDDALRNLAGGEDERRRATQRATVELDQASQGMRKHGALTTEFIQAAARGQTTFAELRWQATATIAKFAGWTAAAGAVYGALAAVRRLGEGAIQTHAGVNQLQRVITVGFDTNSMRSELRALSREMNLPISDVVEATYLMGQVFHDQNEALTAARAVLLGVQTGDMEVAQSAQYLTAIIQGFNLEASDMVDILDLVNAAQNRLGVPVADSSQAIAKAAGTWRVAGGDAESLAASIATIRQMTGATGATIGTTLGRVPYFIRRPENQEILARYGIDTNADVETILEQAQKVANRVGPRAREELAKGIAGPQLGVRVLPLILDEERYRRNLRALQPQARAGASERELEAFLARIDQKIKELGMSLERLGGVLAQAGFLDALALSIDMFGRMLGVVEDLLSLVAELPAPFRQMVVYGAQLAAVFAGLRRFGAFGGVGAGMAGRGGDALGFLARPQYRAHSLVQRGLESQVGYFQNVTEQATQQHAAARVRAQAQAEATQSFARTHITAPIGTDERMRQQQDVLDMTQRQLVTEQEATRLQREVAASKKLTVQAQEELNDWNRIDQRLVYDEAQRRGYVARAGFDQPEHTAPLMAHQLPGYERHVARQGMAQLGPRSTRFRNYVDRQLVAGRVMTANILRTDVQNVGRGYTAMERAVSSGADRMARAGTAIGRARQSVASVPGRMRAATTQIWRSLGTLDRIFLGIGAAFLAAEAIGALMDKMERDASEAEQRMNPRYGRQVRTEDLARRIEEAENFDSPWYADVARSVPVISKPLEDTAVGDALFGADQAAQDAQKELELIRRNQAAARAAGPRVPVPAQTYGEIEEAYKEDLRALADQVITPAQMRERLEQRRMEIWTSQAVAKLQAEGKRGKAQKLAREWEQEFESRMRAEFSQLADQGGPRADVWRGAPIDEVIERMGAMFGRFDAYGATGRDISEVTRGYQTAVSRIGSSGKPEDIQNLNSARSQFLGGLRTVAQEEIEQGLEEADSPEEIRQVYENARTKLERARQQARRGAQRAQRSAEQQRRERDQAREEMLNFIPLPFTDNEGQEKQLRGNWQRARQNYRKARRRAKTQQDEAQVIAAEIARIINELISVPAIETEANYAEIASRARTSATVDEGDDLRADLARLDTAVAQAVRNFGANHIKTLELIAERNEARHELFQYDTAIQDALGRLRIAQAGGGQAGLQQQLAEARRALGRAQANPNEYGRAEIIDLQTAVVEAERAAAEDVQRRMASRFDLRAARTRSDIEKARIMLQKARWVLQHNPDDPIQAMIDFEEAKQELSDVLFDRDISRLELWASRTEDASKQAYRNLVIARRQLRRAPRGTAEFFRARADVRERERERRDALAQDRLDDLEFRAEMNDWTNDALIAGYQRVLDTMKLSKDMRRDLRLKIKRLKDELENEAGLDMEVGNIRLPTVYEIRRAVGAGTSQDRSRQVMVSVYNENNLRVERTADAGEVISELDHAIGSSVSTAFRMAGV